jgi:hypothetical protein
LQDIELAMRRQVVASYFTTRQASFSPVWVPGRRCRLDVRIAPGSGRAANNNDGWRSANSGHRHHSLNGIYGMCRRADPLRLDVREFHYLGPLLSFVGDEFAEISGCGRYRNAAKLAESRFHFGIGQSSVDLSV